MKLTAEQKLESFANKLHKEAIERGIKINPKDLRKIRHQVYKENFGDG